MHRQVQPAPDLAPSATGKQGWRKASAAFGDHADLVAGVVVALGFCWRLWLSHATFFNTDEAWHFSVANQSSLAAAYKASLTLAHPPLMVVVLYFWRHLGTSDVMLRLPGVLAGTIFCWILYKWLSLLFGRTVAWCGLIFATFLPPMIALSAELRQYSFMLVFAAAAAYFLERALAENSARLMVLSSVCLYLAMLSHYSAFLFAASLGIYAILRMLSRRPATGVAAWWAAGQAIGVGLAAVLYVNHIARLSTIYPAAQPLERFGDFYISDWYFHPGRDRLLPFLYRGTFGVFRFTFGQTAVGQVAALLFIAGVVLLIRRNVAENNLPPSRWAAVLLAIPFLLSWVTVAAGLYPYGRTRQCIFLSVFAIAGVSVAMASIARSRFALAVGLAVGVVVICHVFGTLQGRDMLPLAEQRHQHMDQAVQFIRSEISSTDLILTDKATSFQLKHYLCPQQSSGDDPRNGLESSRCDGLQIVSTGPDHGALTPDDVAARWVQMAYSDSGRHLWVVQGGWASGLGEALRSRTTARSPLQIHSFGRYLEVIELPTSTVMAPPR